MDDGPQRLARMVISQALSDAGVGKEDGVRRSTTPLERAHAIAFLTAEGEWERSRQFWCDLANLSAETLREQSTRKLSRTHEAETLPAASTGTGPARGPRPGTKVRFIWDMLASPNGAEPGQIAKAMGWKRLSVMTCIMGDLPQKYGAQCARGADGRYRFVEVPA
jgi:hypothetical protein